MIILGYVTNTAEGGELYDMGIMRYREGLGKLNFPEKRQEYINRLKQENGERVKIRR